MKRRNTDRSKSVQTRGLSTLLCLLRLLGCFPFTRVTRAGAAVVRCGHQTPVALKRAWPLLAWSVLLAGGYIFMVMFNCILWIRKYVNTSPTGVAALVSYLGIILDMCAFFYQATNSDLLALIVTSFQDLLNNVSDVQKIFLRSSGRKLQLAGSQQPLRYINKLRIMFKAIEKSDLLAFVSVISVLVEKSYFLMIMWHFAEHLIILRILLSSLLRVVFICLFTCFMRTLATTLTETRRAIATHLQPSDSLTHAICCISPVDGTSIDGPGTRDPSRSHYDPRCLTTMGATHLRTNPHGQDWKLQDAVRTSGINAAQLKTFESMLRQVERLEQHLFEYFGTPLIFIFLNIILTSISNTYFLIAWKDANVASSLTIISNTMTILLILHGSWTMQKARDASVNWLKDELLRVEDDHVLARGWWLVGNLHATSGPKVVGCFTLDNTCLVAVGSFVATYVVILLQFSVNGGYRLSLTPTSSPSPNTTFETSTSSDL